MVEDNMKKQLRMTHQRETILQELRKCKIHPAADQLYERIKKKLPRISLATVYRNLELLSDAGLIKKLEISSRQKRFDWDTSRHYHISCIRCRRIDNIDLNHSKYCKLRPEDSKGYTISGCRIEFFGLCPKCAKKKQGRQNKEMACNKTNTVIPNDKQRNVLEALAKCNGVCGTKDIAALTHLEPKQISSQITALKKKGYITSPARCQYKTTKKGIRVLS